MLVRHTLYYLPAQIVSPVVQLASILIWAHVLAPEALGVVTLVIAMQEAAFCTFFLWWSQYALRHIARFKEAGDRRAFVRTEVFAVLASTAAQSAVLGPLLIWYFPDYMTPGNALIAGAFLATRSLTQYLAERARADIKILLYTLVQLIGPVFGLGIGLALIAGFGPTPEWVFAGFIAAQAMAMVAALLTSDFAHAAGKPDRSILKHAAGFGVPLMGAQMLAVVAINAPRFIVNHMLGLAATGMFSVGYGLGIRASSFAVMLVTAGAYPLVVRKMETEGLAAAYEQLRKNIALVALAVLPVAMGLLAINHSVVDVLIAEPLRAATYAVLPLTTLGGLFRYLRSHTTDQVFLIRSRPEFATGISVIDLVLAVGSSYVGLLWFGLAGAAAGPMISGVATLSASFIFARVTFDFTPPVGSLLGILAAALIMAGALTLLPPTANAPMLAAYVTAGAFIYAAGVVSFVPMCRRTALWALAAVRHRLAA